MIQGLASLQRYLPVGILRLVHLAQQIKIKVMKSKRWVDPIFYGPKCKSTAKYTETDHQGWNSTYHYVWHGELLRDCNTRLLLKWLPYSSDPFIVRPRVYTSGIPKITPKFKGTYLPFGKFFSKQNICKAYIASNCMFESPPRNVLMISFIWQIISFSFSVTSFSGFMDKSFSSANVSLVAIITVLVTIIWINFLRSRAGSTLFWIRKIR